jgi:hypothetical protein
LLKSEEAAAAAVAKNGQSVMGRQVTVEWSTRELTHKAHRRPVEVVKPKSQDFFRNLVNKKK